MNTRIKLILLFTGILSCSTLFAQEGPKTLDAHFDNVINKSNRYQDYKVVKQYKLNELKTAVNDTLQAYQGTIATLENELAANKTEIDQLKSDLANVQANLDKAIAAENQMSIFGIQTSKGAYNAVMWSILGALLLLLVVFILRFNNSNKVTREAKQKLQEVEEEYEGHRQRSLEREQQIRRKLQDEINKNKKAQV